ncbi:MAG: formyltransferase family protein, partial [bacterium]|nr:formyltransferase family protein [bacterium]
KNYSSILQNTRIDKKELWVALSGWLKKVEGLDPARTFNIHPALLSQFNGRFGGSGMHGHHVHEAVKQALDAGEVTESGVTMHFVTDEYDRGPIFFEYKVPLQKGMPAEEIGEAVNKAEHEYQPKITNMVIHGEIAWDGKDPRTLTVPKDYKWLPETL